jgi:hypothetical protein
MAHEGNNREATPPVSRRATAWRTGGASEPSVTVNNTDWSTCSNVTMIGVLACRTAL